MHMSEESIGRLRDMGRRPARRYASRQELISHYRLEPAGTMKRHHVMLDNARGFVERVRNWLDSQR
jgi:hypothetical protein